MRTGKQSFPPCVPKRSLGTRAMLILHFQKRFFNVAAVAGRRRRVRMTRATESVPAFPSAPDCCRKESTHSLVSTRTFSFPIR